MAITTIDGVLAGMLPPATILKVGTAMEAAGVLHSLFYASGAPGAAAVPAPGVNGAALTSYAGQIPFANPAGGQNTYLARFKAAATAPCSVILADRLWHNSGLTPNTTGAQSITFPGLPARDANGLTNGDDVLIGIEVSTATSNGSAVTNTTASYTNQANASGKTATLSSFPASAAAGTFVPFQLAAGDTGVRSVQSVTLGTSYGAGAAIHLVAYRVLAMLDILAANTGDAIDAVTGGFPRLYDNTVPFLLVLPSATAALTLSGHVLYTQG